MKGLKFFESNEKLTIFENGNFAIFLNVYRNLLENLVKKIEELVNLHLKRVPGRRGTLTLAKLLKPLSKNQWKPATL